MKLRQFTRKVLLAVASALELLTGVALILIPVIVVRALLGGEISGAGIAVARICGMVMLTLGIACWPMPQPSMAALRALLIYNILITPYLALQLVRGATAKGLAVALAAHAVITVLLALAYFSAERDSREVSKTGEAAPQRTGREVNEQT